MLAARGSTNTEASPCGLASRSVIDALFGGRSCRIAAEELTATDEELWTDGLLKGSTRKPSD
jgi:hypothetical protein